MAIQIQGNGGTVAEVDGTNFRALRVTLRPLDYGALGCYSVSGIVGTMAAGLAGNADIFQARWTDATRFAVIDRLGFAGAGGIVAFAAGFWKAEAMIARGWSADGSGGTVLTITGNNQKLRTSMGSSLFGTLRIATTAALGAGTKTFDTQGIGAVMGGLSVTAGDSMVPGELLDTSRALHPIVLTTNEGVTVRATVPATGTWTGGVNMGWSEVAAY